MRKVLATDFGLWPSATDVIAPADKMVALYEYWEKLANYLLLYDQIVIPTGNFLAIPVLRLILGDDIFIELVRSKIIVFARYDRWIGYSGNGAGIISFAVSNDPNDPNRGLSFATSFFSDIEISLDSTLNNTEPSSNHKNIATIKKVTLDATTEIPRNYLFDKIDKDTYDDINGSFVFRNSLNIRNHGRPLNKLKGIKENEMSIFSPHVKFEDRQKMEVWSVLGVAFENMILRIGRFVQSTEITADKLTLAVVRGKGQIISDSSEYSDGLVKIQDIEGIPNIGSAFARKVITSRDLMNLRSSSNAQGMRDWFSDGSIAESADETVRRYVAQINKASWFDSLPMKGIRFVASQVLGFVNPAVGVAVGAADFALSERLAKRPPVRLFLEKSKILLAGKQPVHLPQPLGRNSPCYCGSGKKYKRCHGA